MNRLDRLNNITLRTILYRKYLLAELHNVRRSELLNETQKYPRRRSYGYEEESGRTYREPDPSKSRYNQDPVLLQTRRDVTVQKHAYTAKRDTRYINRNDFKKSVEASQIAINRDLETLQAILEIESNMPGDLVGILNDIQNITLTIENTGKRFDEQILMIVNAIPVELDEAIKQVRKELQDSKKNIPSQLSNLRSNSAPGASILSQRLDRLRSAQRIADDLSQTLTRLQKVYKTFLGMLDQLFIHGHASVRDEAEEALGLTQGLTYLPKKPVRYVDPKQYEGYLDALKKLNAERNKDVKKRDEKLITFLVDKIAHLEKSLRLV